MPFRIYCDTVSCVRYNCTDILTTAGDLPDHMQKIVRYACQVAVTNTCLIRNLLRLENSQITSRLIFVPRFLAIYSNFSANGIFRPNSYLFAEISNVSYHHYAMLLFCHWYQVRLITNRKSKCSKYFEIYTPSYALVCLFNLLSKERLDSFGHSSENIIPREQTKGKAWFVELSESKSNDILASTLPNQRVVLRVK